MLLTRLVCLGFCLLVTGSLKAQTIPTLTATSAQAAWNFGMSTARISGPGFSFFDDFTFIGSRNPCSAPGGCVAPGPNLALSALPTGFYNGTLSLNGAPQQATFEGNARIQYATSTITYPYTPPGNPVQSVTVPVVLLGSASACLAPLYTPCGSSPYIANIAIDIPGSLTIYDISGPGGILQAQFTSVPEPRMEAFLSVGVLLLSAVAYRRRGHKQVC